MLLREFKKGSGPGFYTVDGEVHEKDILTMALKIVDRKFYRKRYLTSSKDTMKYLAVMLSDLQHEVFGLVLLDSQHRVIEHQQMFRGTIDGASVHPREVVKEALKHNAAAVIFYHNHPSGVAEPSTSDRYVTDKLSKALDLIDVRVLDHIIVAGSETVSFGERGLL